MNTLKWKNLLLILCVPLASAIAKQSLPLKRSGLKLQSSNIIRTDIINNYNNDKLLDPKKEGIYMK
jgi:hypothetical protein